MARPRKFTQEAALFCAALAAAGLTQAELAARLHVWPNTVSRWAIGELCPPVYAVKYLRMLRLAQEIIDG